MTGSFSHCNRLATFQGRIRRFEPRRPRLTATILSENGRRCAKYSCSGQVEGTPTLIHPLPTSHDLGFCGFTLSQTTLSGLQSLPKVPRTGIFCTFGREKRQHDSCMEIKEETLENRRFSVNDEALRKQGRATSPCPEIAIWGNKGCTSNLNAPAD